MVRTAMICACLGLFPQAALSADWNLAGGPLFVARSSASPPARQAPTEMKGPFSELIEAAAIAHDLDPDLLRAVVVVESGYRPDARSPAGAAGLAQLMPGTARELGVTDRLDPHQSVMAGAEYLARQIRDFADIRLALAAYNAGPGRVREYGAAPPYRETRDYVRTVTNCFLALKAGRSIQASADCASKGED
jgi:soluble lytic murein transglycosylase-like protein